MFACLLKAKLLLTKRAIAIIPRRARMKPDRTKRYSGAISLCESINNAVYPLLAPNLLEIKKRVETGFRTRQESGWEYR